jgi:hypothetical protein
VPAPLLSSVHEDKGSGRGPAALSRREVSQPLTYLDYIDNGYTILISMHQLQEAGKNQ